MKQASPIKQSTSKQTTHYKHTHTYIYTHTHKYLSVFKLNIYQREGERRRVLIVFPLLLSISLDLFPPLSSLLSLEIILSPFGKWSKGWCDVFSQRICAFWK